MLSPVDVFRNGGPLMYPLLLVFILGLSNPVIAAIPSLLRWRVPAPAWLLAPVALLCVGFTGTIWGFNQALQAVAMASEETKTSMAAAGYAVGSITSTTGWLGGGALLCLTALLGGLSNLRIEGEVRWTAIPAGIGLVVVVLASGACLIGAAITGSPASALTAISAAVAGIGVTAIGLRAPAEVDYGEAIPADTGRNAGARALAAFAGVLGVIAVSRAATGFGEMSVFMAAASASLETKDAILTRGLAEIGTASALGAICATALGVAGLANLLPVSEQLTKARALLSALAAMALLSVPLGLLLLKNSYGGSLTDLAGL